MQSRLDVILSNSNPAAAGKLYDNNYVMVPADQIIIRSSIKNLLQLKKSIDTEHMGVKRCLDDLYSKSGSLKQGESCAKSFAEGTISTIRELEKNLQDNVVIF